MAFWDEVAKNISQAGQNVGRFFGIGNQPQKKKKQPQPGEPGYVAPNRNTQPGQQQAYDQNQSLQPKKPVNIFEDLNKNLTLGQNKPVQPNKVSVASPLPNPVANSQPKIQMVQPKPLNADPLLLKHAPAPPPQKIPLPKVLNKAQFDKLNPDKQSDYVSKLKDAADRNKLDMGDKESANTRIAAENALRDTTGQKFSWGQLGKDLLGGVAGAVTAPAKSVINTAQQQERRNRLEDLARQGKISIDDYNRNLKDIYEGSIDTKVAEGKGQLKTRGTNPLEFGQKFTGEGLDFALNTVAGGTGKGVGLTKDAITEALKIGGVYGIGQNVADVANKKNVDAGSVVTNMITGGAVGGLGHLLPSIFRGFRSNPNKVSVKPDNLAGVAQSGDGRQAADIQTAIEKANDVGDSAEVSRLIETLPEDLKAPMKSALGLEKPKIHFDPKTGKVTYDTSTPTTVAPPVVKTLQPVLPNIHQNNIDLAMRDTAEAVGNSLNGGRVQVPVRKDIPVEEALGDSLDIPVSVNTPQKPQGPIIREIGGDAPSVGQNSANAIEVPTNSQAPETPVYRPDQRIEGVTPTNTGNTGLFTRAEINNERLALDEALANKELTKTQHKAANKELDTLSAVDDAPQGQKIDVKEVTGIPVADQTVVPSGLPETPGTVRTTSAADPNAARTEVVANTPVAAVPPQISAEAQAVLDNPRQFNKRQVAAARNQRKLAKQMAKTQEQTAEALNRIETASPAAQSGEGFVPTGEFSKSVNGGPIQKASRAVEMQQAVQETSQMSPQDVLQTARTNQGQTGGFSRRDIRNIAALIETKRIARGTPEWQEARTILKEDGTVWGQTGALRNYTMRRNATTDELIGRYESKIYRLADDPTKIESKWFDEVEAAEDAYVVARDDATAAYNEFTRNPTNANAKVYHAAQDAAEKADRAAKKVEYSVATKALKGNKDVKQVRELDKMANDADMYQMDAVDASMLSGTGTFVRNFVNAAVGGVEEGLFGKVASRIAGKLTGQKIGGGAGKGTVSGFGEGVSNLVDVSKARASNAGKNPLEHVKNWATTGNQLGDTVIDSQVKHNVLDHYTQLLKDQGYAGRELTDRASVMARQDPDNLAREYAGTARVAAGLGSGITRNNKVETLIKNVVSDAVSGGKPNRLTEATGKLVARMTVGFPTAIGRSTVEGVKRFTLGAPTFVKAMRQTDPVKRSMLVKEGIKQAGTGAFVLPPLFYALGASDMISGAYPADKETRAQWEREGKTENSIKIDGAWYQLPAYLGAWAVPGLFYASLGRSNGDFSEAAADSAKAIPSLLPTDQASNILDVVNGRTDLGKFMAQSGAATVRAATPAGALLNQISKSFDPTKNDTTSGSTIENFVNKVLSGIPGVNNIAGIPDKTSDTGASITNPNPLEILAGAASDVQGGGEARSAEIQQESNNKLQGISDSGILDDPNLKGILEGKEKAIYDKIKSGKELKEGDLEDLQKAFVKGVSATGDDTAYLEREQYDSNLRVLQLKKQLMEADKTVKPSDIAKIDTSIKRGEIYKEYQVPYDLISNYQGTGVAEWRKMGDPESDDYDPDTYQKLFEIDKALTDKGVSYKRGAPDKPKYTAKASKAKRGSGGRGGGRGGSGSGSNQIDTDFGKLKDSTSAPRVQQYDTIEAKSGSVPIIRKVRPNIVHKITSSG